MNSFEEFRDALPIEYADDMTLKLLRDAELAEKLVSSLSAVDPGAGLDKLVIRAGGQRVSIGLWHVEVLDFLRTLIEDTKQLAIDELSTRVENRKKFETDLQAVNKKVERMISNE